MGLMRPYSILMHTRFPSTNLNQIPRSGPSTSEALLTLNRSKPSWRQIQHTLCPHSFKCNQLHQSVAQTNRWCFVWRCNFVIKPSEWDAQPHCRLQARRHQRTHWRKYLKSCTNYSWHHGCHKSYLLHPFKCYKYSSSFILLLKGPVAAIHFPLVSSIQQLLFIGDLCPTPQEIKWALIRLKQWRDKLSFKYLLKGPPISSLS